MNRGHIFCVDVGVVSAFACGAPGCREPVSGFYDFREEFGTNADKFFKFGCWLSENLAHFCPEFFGKELPFTRHGPAFNMNAEKLILGFDAIALGKARERRLKIQEFQINEVSKFFIGRGKVLSAQKKREFIRVCKESYGWSAPNEHVADAKAVWAFSEHRLLPSAAMARGIGPLFPSEVMKAQRKRKPAQADLLSV